MSIGFPKASLFRTFDLFSSRCIVLPEWVFMKFVKSIQENDLTRPIFDKDDNILLFSFGAGMPSVIAKFVFEESLCSSVEF